MDIKSNYRDQALQLWAIYPVVYVGIQTVEFTASNYLTSFSLPNPYKFTTVFNVFKVFNQNGIVCK